MRRKIITSIGGIAALMLFGGARFAGPVAEHHDGYSMWDSKVNEWNSVALGPKLNLAKLHVDDRTRAVTLAVERGIIRLEK